MSVSPKKHLGQHFLNDAAIAQQIVDELERAVNDTSHPVDAVVEVGPGTGALTQRLLQKVPAEFHVVEIDRAAVAHLQRHFPSLKGRIHQRDFLSCQLDRLFPQKQLAVIGNFPYNISSQILFHLLAFKDQVNVVVGMFQREVAERIAEPPGTKKYGVISVLLQAYYTVEYLFTVDEHVFHPPPKVKSGVIRLLRNATQQLPCDASLFAQVVKMAFNQRRKTLRNSLKPLLHNRPNSAGLPLEMLNRRPETLSVADFVLIAQHCERSAPK